MRFSIIIPAYNAETTIINTLNSVIKQTFCDYEIIIVNDGSTDNTDDIIKNYILHKNITCKYFITDNHGVSSARNMGWENADGDYICFLDSDDVWHYDRLKILNKILLEYNCDFLGHSYQEIGNINQSINSYTVKRVNILKYLLKNIFQTSCVCLRKSITMRFDESMSYSEDYDLFLNIVKSFNTYYFNCALTKLNRPQLTKGGLSQNKLKMRIGELKAYKKFCFKYKYFLPILPVLICWSLVKHIRLYLNVFLKYFRYYKLSMPE